MRLLKKCARFEEYFPLRNKSQYIFHVINYIKRNVNKDKIQFHFSYCLSNIRKE